MKHLLLIFLSVLLLTAAVSSCNDSSSGYDYDYSSVNADVALLSFNLRDTDTTFDLSNVFFTIDLVGGRVFNADSLPYGTKIDSLIVNMTFTYPSKVYLMNETDTIDYLKSPADTISFAAGVRLKVVSKNETERIYDLKVNVHRLKSDSLQWVGLSGYSFPGIADLRGQKTLLQEGRCVTFVQDGPLYKKLTPDGSGWNNPVTVAFPANADLRSLSLLNGSFYLRDTAGSLFRSDDDGLTWSAVSGIGGVSGLIGTWSGASGDRLVGVLSDGGAYYRFAYDGSSLQRESAPIDASFPISGYSNPILFQQGIPQLAFAGGRLTDGTLTNAVWGYDGNGWVSLNNVGESGVVGPPFSPREGAQLVPYYNGSDVLPKWILFGGKNAAGAYLRDIYYSLDLGINWFEGGPSLQLPETIPSMAYASLYVLNRAPFGEQVWRSLTLPSREYRAVSRSAADVADAPYIYVFGGEGTEAGQAVAFNQVWRGVINVMRFAPIE